MASTEHSIELEVPVQTAYNQWTQFESFPTFMEGVQEVRQLDDTHLHWRANVSGKVEEWDAVITEQIPDQKIAWQSTSGAPNSGVVLFEAIGPDRTRITLQLGYEPQGAVESMGSALGLAAHTVKSDLERFKHMIEERGSETGSWRGTVDNNTDVNPL